MKLLAHGESPSHVDRTNSQVIVMKQVLGLVPVLCLFFAMNCGSDSGGSKTQSAGKAGSAAPAPGGQGGGKSCGTLDCTGALAVGVDNTSESCCVDASKSLCGSKNSAGACTAPKQDSRCPAFTGRIGEFRGCCTENNMCGLDTMGVVGWACLPLSAQILRSNEPNAPQPKACDAP
jgi:hypothetical protein